MFETNSLIGNQASIIGDQVAAPVLGARTSNQRQTIYQDNLSLAQEKVSQGELSPAQNVGQNVFIPDKRARLSANPVNYANVPVGHLQGGLNQG